MESEQPHQIQEIENYTMFAYYDLELSFMVILFVCEQIVELNFKIVIKC